MILDLRLAILDLKLKSAIGNLKLTIVWPRSTMDSIRVSEAPDPSSILGEATMQVPCPTDVGQAGIPVEATRHHAKSVH